MTEAEWLVCTDPKPMLEFLGERGSPRKLRLFAVACCRRAWHLLVDEGSRRAAEVAERFADGTASFDELWAVHQDAWEFSLHVVHNDPSYFDLDDCTLNAADIPAWAAEEDPEPLRAAVSAQRALGSAEAVAQAALLRCIFGNPFRTVVLDPALLAWQDGTVANIAQGVYDDRAFDRLPILADALEDAGCTDASLLNHLRSAVSHVRGCWVLDLLMGKG
jgi:hypothetical protein